MSAEQFRKLPVRAVMQKPIRIRESTSIEVAFAQISASASEMVGVVDDNDRLTGTATKTSILNELLEGKKKSDPIKDAMYRVPSFKQISEDETVEDAIKVMNDNKVDKLPVVDRDGRLVGTVSRKDLLSKANSYLRFRL